MSELFKIIFAFLSFFLFPWALTNAKTDGDGLTIKQSVLLVAGLCGGLALSLLPKSVLEKGEEA